MRKLILPITGYLVLFLSLHTEMLSAQSTNSPPDPQFSVDCNCPKEKSNLAFAILVLFAGAMAFFGIYKCAKKIGGAAAAPTPPNPPPPDQHPCSPPCGCTNVVPGHIYDWPHTNCTKTRINGNSLILNFTNPPTRSVLSFDYSQSGDTFTGLPSSTTNAFLTFNSWTTTLRDREGNLYNGWLSGVLPIVSSDDMIHWQHTLTITGWVSDYSLLIVCYDQGRPVATNYSTLADSSDINYDWTTNVQAMVVDPSVGGSPQRFYKAVPH